MKYYLITYRHRYHNRTEWTHENQVIKGSPAEWVRNWVRNEGSEFRLTFAIEITKAEHDALREIL